MRAVAVLLAAGLLAGCGGASYFPTSLFEAVEPCNYGDGRTTDPVIDEFRSRWYSSHLQAAREPRLGGETPPYEVNGLGVLRFTWLRSFDAPVIVRVEATADDGLRLTAKELSGAGGYDPGRIARRVERRLSTEEAAQLTNLLVGSRVLDLPPSDDCPIVDDPGNGDTFVVRADGAQWVIEANGSTGYRYVDRWSGEGPVHDLGLHLLGLTGWIYDRVY
jgi:hypothetical protein